MDYCKNIAFLLTANRAAGISMLHFDLGMRVFDNALWSLAVAVKLGKGTVSNMAPAVHVHPVCVLVTVLVVIQRRPLFTAIRRTREEWRVFCVGLLFGFINFVQREERFPAVSAAMGVSG